MRSVEEVEDAIETCEVDIKKYDNYLKTPKDEEERESMKPVQDLLPDGAFFDGFLMK